MTISILGSRAPQPASGRRAVRSWSGFQLAGGLLALLVGVGCGQEAPAEPLAGSYHPLVAGSWWDYEHNSWTERVTLASTTYEGSPAFVLSSSADPDDGIRSDAIIADQDGRVVRLVKDDFRVASTGDVPVASVTYGVGFTRFNEAWAGEAVGFKESPEYTRVETPPGGSARPGEFRKHTFEVLSLSEQVVTAAGSFDCIKIRRTKDWQADADGLDADEAQAKTFWFARGVGRVQERNDETGRTESLSAFVIPE